MDNPKSPSDRGLLFVLRYLGIVLMLMVILTSTQIGSPVWAAIELTPGEIPPNDFRISHMGPDGDISSIAGNSAMAYNSQRDEFLVVWQGYIQGPVFNPGGTEIYGQLIDGATASLIGNMKRISFMGLDGDNNYLAFRPDVSYNSTRNEFLVVWEGNENTHIPNINEYEIWGQRLSYNVFGGLVLTGSELRISNMGPDGDPAFLPYRPAVAYNHINDEYLVVWEGDDNTPPLVDGEKEIFGQYMAYAGDLFGYLGADFRISYMGPNGNPNSDALSPDIAVNETDEEYLVVWHGNENPIGQDDEIWGRRILANRSFEPQQKYSDMGTGESDFFANNPAVTYNPDAAEWLIVWEGNKEFPVRWEIFGQFLGYTAGGLLDQTGIDDFRFSDMGPDGNPSYNAYSPKVDYNPLKKKYLVVWYGVDNTGTLENFEQEIFGQLIDANTRAEVGYNDFRLSDMGPVGDNDYMASNPSVAYSNMHSNFLVIWHGDDNIAPLVNDEIEIFGQRYSVRLPVFLPLVFKDS